MRMARALRAGTIVAAAALALLLCRPALAGETWDGNGGDNNWSTGNNWNPNGDPPNDGSANIVMAGTNRLTPRVDVDWDISSLVFSNTAGGFSISGDPGVSLGIGAVGISNQDTQLQILLLPINLNTSQSWIASQGQLSVGNTIAGHFIIQRTLTLSGSNNTQISGAITTAIAINKSGSGTLTFNSLATNTYSGNTTVSAGTLALNRTGGPNRAIPGNLIIGDGFGSGDTVRLDSADQISEAVGNTVTVNSSGLLNLNGFSETSRETIQNLTLNGGSISGAGRLTVNGSITTGASTTSVISSQLEADSLIIGGAGTLTLSGSERNFTSGNISINGGTVLLNKPFGVHALGRTADLAHVTIGDGVGSDVVRLMASHQITDDTTLTVKSSGLLDLNGFYEELGPVFLEGGSVATGTGRLEIPGYSGLTVNSSAQTATFSGNLLLSVSGLPGGEKN